MSAAAPPSGQPADELTPRQLADAWKKGGGFDSLRKQLLQDFLASPEKDALLTELDSLIPTLLATTPALARAPRQARVAQTTSLLDSRGALNGPVLRLENRLQSGKGVGRTVRRELKRVLCDQKGLEYVDDEPEEEEPTAPVQSQKEPPQVEPPAGSAQDTAEPAAAASDPPADAAALLAAPPALAPKHAQEPSPGPPPSLETSHDTTARTLTTATSTVSPIQASERLRERSDEDRAAEVARDDVEMSEAAGPQGAAAMSPDTDLSSAGPL